MEYSIEHQGSRWLIVSNDSIDEQGVHDQRAQNFQLMSTPQIKQICHLGKK